MWVSGSSMGRLDLLADGLGDFGLYLPLGIGGGLGIGVGAPHPPIKFTWLQDVGLRCDGRGRGRGRGGGGVHDILGFSPGGYINPFKDC